MYPPIPIMQIITLLLILIQQLLSQCETGCLRCSVQNVCLFCDITKNYALIGAKCIKTVSTDCTIISQKGTCAVCSISSYLDSNTGKCVAVSTAKLVQSCGSYSSTQSCLTCSGNFFISSGKCLVVNATIPNCLNYFANGVCGRCGKGFILSTDFVSCTSLPNEPNCSQYTMLKCTRCSKGFFLNPNWYFKQLDSIVGINSAVANTITPNDGIMIPLRVCEIGIVPNCKMLVSAKECSKCDDGFYLNSGSCVQNPLPTITACAIYSSLTRCDSCQSDFYLAGNTCVKVVPIANCQSYDGASPKSTCIRCSTSFYLQNGQCTPRVASKEIPQCNTPSISADVCMTCNSGFNLTSDSLACLSPVTNCQQHSASTVTTTAFDCVLCRPGFFLEKTSSVNSCSAGTVNNCWIFQLNSKECSVCKNQFYLSGGLCVAHLQISNCVMYHPTIADQCSICASGSYPLQYSVVCNPTTLVNNCLTYSIDGTQCLSCAVGFYLVGGVCAIIPNTFANCLTFNGASCTRCQDGFMVNTISNVNNCVRTLSYVNATTNNPCAEMVALSSTVVPTWANVVSFTQSSLKCLTCADGMYPFSPVGNEAICIPTAELVLVQGFSTVTNCQRYGLNYAVLTAIVCMECVSGFFLSGYQALAHRTAATSCISSCPLTTSSSNVIVYDDGLGFVTICVPFSLTGVFVNSGRCSATTRTKVSNIGSSNINDPLLPYYSSDFSCIRPAPETGAVPQNYFRLPLTVDSSSFFSYQIVSASVPVTTSVAFTNAYSNTVDTSGPSPLVLNYQGILNHITQIEIPPLLLITRFNSISFCDIIWELGNNGVFGTPFDGGAGPFPYRPALSYFNTHYTTCLRCQFGYQLSFASSGAVTSNSPFPSCQPMSTCASNSIVYGGLPPHLNSILSCHSCLQIGGVQTYPTIVIDVDGVGTTAATNKPGMYISFTVRSIYSNDGLTVTQPNGFSCSAPLSPMVVNDNADVNTLTQPSISGCAVYGKLFIITAYASPNSETTLAVPAAPLTGNSIFNLAETGGTGGSMASPTTTPTPSRNFCLACIGNNFPAYLLNTIVDPLSLSNAYSTNNRFPSWVVISCTTSSNCDSTKTTQFNSCAACRTDQDTALTPVYYAFHDFTLTNCYRSPTPNCFILSSSPFSTTENTNLCMVCRSGYSLNSDGQCHMLSVHGMSTAKTNYFAVSLFGRTFYQGSVLQTVVGGLELLRVHYLLSGLQYGAKSCLSGFTLSPVCQWAPTICAKSSYIFDYNRVYPSNTVFVNNCNKYNLTLSGNRYVCGGCKSGFIPTIDGSSCVSSAALPNCIFTQSGVSSGLCYKCSAKYVNVNGLCAIPKIANCAIFENTQYPGPSSVLCLECASGFVLSTDATNCQSGKVTNCDDYVQGNDSKCSTCKSGFALIVLTAFNYCYPIPASLNCVTLMDGDLENGIKSAQLTCTKCEAGSTKVFGLAEWTTTILPTAAKSLCSPFTAVPSCLAYSQNDTNILTNTFSCLRCSSNFYFAPGTNSCLPRRTTTENCATFAETKDVCDKCNPGFFLSTNGLLCSAYPVGIQYCLVYTGPSTCSLCAAPAFVSSGLCSLSIVIPNCQVYLSNNTCGTCAEDFYLTNSTLCSKSIATKCLTFSSISSCSTCPPKFGLQSSNGVTNCIQINLPNCSNSTVEFPFICLECENGYFVSPSGSCSPTLTQIAGCRLYDSERTCLICSKGFLLSVDRTTCNSTGFLAYLDSNCEDQFLVNSPVCAVCQLGFYFEGDKCVSCQNMTLAKGCYSCDSTEQNKCLFCKSNFYMNASGVCLRSSDSETVRVVNTTTTPAKNFIVVLKGLLMLLVWLLN